MKSWQDIEKLLKEAPPKEMIKPPNEAAGIFGNYLEAQFVVSELNRIFGVDGWEGTLGDCIKTEREDLSVVFFANYIIVAYGTVGEDVSRAVSRANGGVCVASSRWDKTNKCPLPPKPQALDTAYKGAISDAIKRTAKDFGNALGLWLYFDDKELMVMHKLATGEELPEQPGPSVEVESRQTGPDPYIYPKKDWKETVSALTDEHGKLQASQLFEAIGDEAIGYMEWLWPKLCASDKKWDQQAGNELKAWLDIYKGTREIVVKPTSNTKSQLITLLKAAPDDKFITVPIVNPLKQYLAEAGYVDKEGAPNMFHINGLLKKMTGNEHASLNGLTGKQAKSLVNYCAYLIENGGDTAKDFAQHVLMRAWADNVSWKESCDLISSSYVQPELPGMIDLDSICVGMGTTLANVEAALSENCGWPLPLPEKQLVDFLKVCKDKGFSLKVGEDYTRFDKIAVQLAQAVAQQEGWVK